MDSCPYQQTILTRRNSLQSLASSDGKLSSVQAKPVEVAESRSLGEISLDVYSSYFSAGGHSSKIIFLLFICIFTQLVASSGDCWLSYWYCKQIIFL